MKQIAYEFHNSDTGDSYVDYDERNGLGKDQGYTQIPLYSKEAEERKTASFSRIREFIRKQRSIGEHLFAKRLRRNYGKRADEFYDQFADSVYYRDKDGNEIGLDIQTLWWFRWNEFASQSLPEITNDEIIDMAHEAYPDFDGIPDSHTYSYCRGAEEYRNEIRNKLTGDKP